MAIVTFKPVCECGYIFKHFEYDYNPKPPIKVYAADAEEGDIHKAHYIHQSAISPERSAGQHMPGICGRKRKN